MSDLPDPETMAKTDGYTSAYGARTWGELLEKSLDDERVGYETSRADNPTEVTQELAHVMQQTGDPAATLDPKLPPSMYNRIV